MSHEQSKVYARNRARVDVYQDAELVYWTNTLGVTRDQLLLAVAKVGSAVDDVKRVLGKA